MTKICVHLPVHLNSLPQHALLCYILTWETLPAPVKVNIMGPRDSGYIPSWISFPTVATAALAELLLE